MTSIGEGLDRTSKDIGLHTLGIFGLHCSSWLGKGTTWERAGTFSDAMQCLLDVLRSETSLVCVMLYNWDSERGAI